PSRRVVEGGPAGDPRTGTRGEAAGEGAAQEDGLIRIPSDAFSYIDTEKMEEKFVGVPEEGGTRRSATRWAIPHASSSISPIWAKKNVRARRILLTGFRRRSRPWRRVARKMAIACARSLHGAAFVRKAGLRGFRAALAR